MCRNCHVRRIWLGCVRRGVDVRRSEDVRHIFRGRPVVHDLHDETSDLNVKTLAFGADDGVPHRNCEIVTSLNPSSDLDQLRVHAEHALPLIVRRTLDTDSVDTIELVVERMADCMAPKHYFGRLESFAGMDVVAEEHRCRHTGRTQQLDRMTEGELDLHTVRPQL